MTALDLSHLSGPDAVVAVRSFPRRFRAAVLPVDDPEVAEVAERIGPDGHSALEVVWHTANTFALLRQALHDAVNREDAVLHPAVLDEAARGWDTPPGLTPPDALDHLDGEATALAAVADPIEPPVWSRTVAVAGGGQVRVIDVLHAAVRAGSEGLHQAERTIAAVR